MAKEKIELDKEILRWFHQLEIELKEKFDLDTSDPADVGRLTYLRVSEITNGTRKEIPLDGDISKVKGDIVAEPRYAMFEWDDDGEYKEKPPEEVGGSEMLDWLYSQSKTFHVTYDKETDTYEMESDLSKKQLQYFYEAAKHNRIGVAKPGHAMGELNSNGTILMVTKDNKPYFCTEKYKTAHELTDEEFREFFSDEKNAEYLGMDPANLKVRAALNNWALSKIVDGKNVYDEIEDLVKATNDYLEKIPVFSKFQTDFWDCRHHDYNVMTPNQNKMHTSLDNFILYDAYYNTREMNDFDNKLRYGDGLENLFVEDDNGELCPLFEDHVELRKTLRSKEKEKEIERQFIARDVHQRILEAMEKKKLCVYEKSKDDFTRMSIVYPKDLEDEHSKMFFTEPMVEKPVKPSFYGFKKLFSFLSKSFKKQVQDYDKAMDKAMRYPEVKLAGIIKRDDICGEIRYAEETERSKTTIEERNRRYGDPDAKPANDKKKEAPVNNKENKKESEAEVPKAPMDDETAKEVFAGRMRNIIRSGKYGTNGMRYTLIGKTDEEYKNTKEITELWKDEAVFGKIKEQLRKGETDQISDNAIIEAHKQYKKNKADETAKEVFAGRMLDIIRKDKYGTAEMRDKLANMTAGEYKNSEEIKELWNDEAVFGRIKEQLRKGETDRVSDNDILNAHKEHTKNRIEARDKAIQEAKNRKAVEKTNVTVAEHRAKKM